MKPTFLFLLLALLLGGPAAQAQSGYQVPDYTLRLPEDYIRFEPQVVEAVNWLEKTPAGQQTAQRQAANKFVFQWLSGSSNVQVQLQKYVADLVKQDPDQLLLFMGGWARYQLQHPEVQDEVLLNVEGIHTLLVAYQAGGYKKNKQLDELLRLRQQNQLPAWVTKQLGR
ncbi:hypothetical protein [Hymenobacter psychrophilus]|uniref:Uncharacterized protein n=1 Tax=Hymenobacter psychrophilus TaxID=651662 RepID=A0A1H3BGN4_9BACT|nr:hypothetical protein [Hymenobacter psychrophilus]SDX40878.1 hypothetical protein SAMN04488069_101279 [Hymenobacter psychrophilus]